ncbi:MAG: M15 family metallopeptidase [Pirellulales bacterium]
MPAATTSFLIAAFHSIPAAPERSRWYRDQLRAVAEADGFDVYEFEWWHFDFRGLEEVPDRKRDIREVVIGRRLLKRRWRFTPIAWGTESWLEPDWLLAASRYYGKA